MANSPLFSTYRSGENRVTSSLMAVFQRIEIGLVEQLLGAATGESALSMVTYVNQPRKDFGSIPDAHVSANFDYWFETKTTPNAVRPDQLKRHVERLKAGEGNQYLFVVTPDNEKPAAVAAFDDPRVVWFNFLELSNAIDGALDAGGPFIGEHAQFLLRELQQLFAEDGLLGAADTVIVAAAVAWGEFEANGMYICQPNRSFRPGLKYMGFYHAGQIEAKIAKILDQRSESIRFDESTVAGLRQGSLTDRRIADAVESSLLKGPRGEGPYRVFVLSRTAEEGLVELAQPIKNVGKSITGRTSAWTQGQRYTVLRRLTAPGVLTTDDLRAAGE
jgi:hypothetical protein